MQSYCESGNKFFTVELVEYTNVISWMVVWFKEESNSMLLPDGLVLTFEDLNFSLSNSKKKSLQHFHDMWKLNTQRWVQMKMHAIVA